MLHGYVDPDKPIQYEITNFICHQKMKKAPVSEGFIKVWSKDYLPLLLFLCHLSSPH